MLRDKSSRYRSGEVGIHVTGLFSPQRQPKRPRVVLSPSMRAKCPTVRRELPSRL